MKERILQLVTAAILSIGGLILLFVGMLIAPQGVIHETVLVAFGEVATFAGSIIGINYKYKIKNQKSHITNDKYNPDPPPDEPEQQSGIRQTIRPL